MRTPYSRLQERVSFFGNHHRKYLQLIESKQNALIDLLAARGLVDQIHLWRAAGSRLSKEMQIVRTIGQTTREQLEFLGWFYATQFLLMNIREIDVLSLNLTFGRNRLLEYRHFMKQIGSEFRHLTSVYMENLLDLFLEKQKRPEFAILSVGTRADQDDIDIAIIDDGSALRRPFNNAVGQLQREMLKHASRLHFYLAEQMDAHFYSASIPEYEAIYQTLSHDFILINEMLGAALITGSKKLLYEFQDRITQCYYYDKKSKDNRYHEVYLRGILGEIRSLLAPRMHHHSVHPKDDALRLIKGLAYAYKTVYSIRRVNNWNILDDLSVYQPRLKKEFAMLGDMLSFFEIFRFLYQLFIVQEEEIYLDDREIQEHLELVAVTMGFRPAGNKKASDFLLVNYYDNLEMTRNIARTLLDDLKRHLKNCTVFISTFQNEKKLPEKRHSILKEFYQVARFFRGTKFWEDILEILAEDNGRYLKIVVEEWQQLSPDHQKIYCQIIARTGRISFYAVISLLVMVTTHQRNPVFKKFFNMLNTAFFNVLAKNRSRTWRIVRLYNYNPRLINYYIMSLNESNQKEFFSLLETGEIYYPEDIVIKEKLEYLGGLYLDSSRYFRRYFIEVVNKYPQFIEFIDDTEQLRKFAKGFFGTIEKCATLEEKKEKLRDSFYVDFFRLGLETLAGTSLESIEREYTEFVFNYLQELYGICKQEIETELKIQLYTRDSFAIFVTGSMGREQAFDDDFDLIVVLNSDDETLRANCSRVITRMNREIIRLAVLPHYRFAEHFGNYLITMRELEDFLKQDNQLCFIEKSQLLGAQMIVGSSLFEREFMERIIRPYIYEDQQHYFRVMLDEMKSRHNALKTLPDWRFSLKEAVGGLRDIELILLFYKTKYQISAPLNRRIIDFVMRKSAENAAEIQELGEQFDFLKYMRTVYRIAVAAKNTLDKDNLERTAQIMGFQAQNGVTASEKLLNCFIASCDRTTEIINNLLTKIFYLDDQLDLIN
ncbi:hypothetical protein JW964_15425 [candidate division KSB1 bacterium]|nr:hypothetical protein [candidate division KSB1 bacterium]